MRKTFKLQLISLLGLALSIGQVMAVSEVYKKIEQDGRVTYSDTPLENAELIELTPVKTYTAPPLPQESTDSASSSDDAVEPESYSVMIVSPDPDSFIPIGTNGIEVKIFTTPGLYENHRLRLSVDNKQYGDLQTSNLFFIKEIENGSHTLKADVVSTDDSDQILSSSNEITIHTKRSYLFNPGLPSAPQMPRAPQAPLAPRAP